MISIIVSTYQPDNFSKFEQNVKDTIGDDVCYEVIKIENPGIMGLCEAYNRGIDKAKYSYLCFCHDDILFCTFNWGSILIDLFKTDSQIGLVGCAGSSYKPWVPSGWSSPQISDLFKINYTQYNPNTFQYHNYKSSKKGYDEVASLDGLWMACPKKITEKVRFSADYLKGYHCYDVDFSLQVGLTHKVVVSYDIDIEHLSVGSFSVNWLSETYKLHKKWNKFLPKYVEKVSKQEMCNQEVIAYKFLLNKTLDFRVCLSGVLKVLFSLRFFSLVGINKWLGLVFSTFASFFNKFVLNK